MKTTTITIIGHSVKISGIDINELASIAFDDVVEQINDSILGGEDAGSFSLDKQEYEWEIVSDEKDEEIQNLARENKMMEEALATLGFSQKQVSSICSGAKVKSSLEEPSNEKTINSIMSTESQIKPWIEQIKEMEDTLAITKKAYRDSEGQRILRAILIDENAPESLKSFLMDNEIDFLSIENTTLSDDYMPDWAHMLNLQNSSVVYSFRMSSSECFTDEYTPENEETCFFTEDDLANSQDENFDANVVWDYLTTKIYVPNCKEPFVS